MSNKLYIISGIILSLFVVFVSSQSTIFEPSLKNGKLDFDAVLYGIKQKEIYGNRNSTNGTVFWSEEYHCCTLEHCPNTIFGKIFLTEEVMNCAPNIKASNALKVGAIALVVYEHGGNENTSPGRYSNVPTFTPEVNLPMFAINFHSGTIIKQLIQSNKTVNVLLIPSVNEWEIMHNHPAAWVLQIVGLLATIFGVVLAIIVLLEVRDSRGLGLTIISFICWAELIALATLCGYFFDFVQARGLYGFGLYYTLLLISHPIASSTNLLFSFYWLETVNYSSGTVITPWLSKYSKIFIGLVSLIFLIMIFFIINTSVYLPIDLRSIASSFVGTAQLLSFILEGVFFLYAGYKIGAQIAQISRVTSETRTALTKIRIMTTVVVIGIVIYCITNPLSAVTQTPYVTLSCTFLSEGSLVCMAIAKLLAIHHSMRAEKVKSSTTTSQKQTTSGSLALSPRTQSQTKETSSEDSDTDQESSETSDAKSEVSGDTEGNEESGEESNESSSKNEDESSSKEEENSKSSLNKIDDGEGSLRLNTGRTEQEQVENSV